METMRVKQNNYAFIDSQNLNLAIREQGWRLVFKPILRSPGGKIKGNVDADLVLHTMIEFPNYDKAAVVTGDGDFYCLIEYLLEQDRLLKLIIPNQYKYSSLLRRFMAQFSSFVKYQN